MRFALLAAGVFGTALVAVTARAQPSAPANAAPPADPPKKPPEPPPETVQVRGDKPTQSITRRTLEQREIEAMPGTGGDALRTIESLPGVARAPAFSGLIIMRGSAPQDSQVFMDGASVPLAFHFGGLAAIVPTEVIARLDVYPGNFDVGFGRGLGGIVDVGLRSPAKDRIHAIAKADLLDVRALVEGPLDDKTRVLVAARRSWFDAWFPAVAKDLQVGVTASPVYYDWQLVAERDLSPSATLRASFIGSSDRLAVTLPPGSADPSFTGTLNNTTTFWRAQLRGDGKVGKNVRWSTMASFGHDTLGLDLGPLHANEDVWRVTARADVDARISSKLRARAGIDVEAGWYDFSLAFPPVPTPDEPDTGPIFGRAPLTQTRSGTYFDPAIYASLEYAPVAKVRLNGGVRVDSFSGVPKVAVQPRGSVRYLLADYPRKTTLKGAIGLYAQEPQLFENDPVFGTPNIAYESGVHASVGIEQQLTANVELTVEPFYKYLYDVVSRRPDATTTSGFRYGNEGSGFVYGTEVLLKYKPDARFLGWIAYTISKSERRSLPEQDLRIFEYDQTHVLAALGSVRLGGGWEIGARVRYITGFPYTPILGGAFDADAGAYSPIEKRPLYSGRVAPYFTVDVRAEKTWTIGEHARVSVYLDVLNATNHRNAEGITSNFDYALTSRVNGIPILPVLGVRGEL